MPNQRPRRKREHAREAKRESVRETREARVLVHSLSIVCVANAARTRSAIVDLVYVFSHLGRGEGGEEGPRHRGERAEKPNGAADSFYRARYRW